MSGIIRIVGYNLTDDPDFMDRQNHMTPYLKDMIQELYADVHNGKRSVIPHILKLIDQFPKNPQLKNFLSVAYNNMGEIEKSEEVNRWILKEHPEYLFGILNKAASYFYRREFYKIPRLLGEKMELKDLYPKRDIFHVGEFTSFTKFAVQYFVEIGNIQAAQQRMNLLTDLFPEHPDSINTRTWFQARLLEKGPQKQDGRHGNKNVVQTNPFSEKQTVENPVFVHHEIYSLYEFDLSIPHVFFENILVLPRETVIADLEHVILDGIYRYHYFEQLQKSGTIGEDRLTFPLHAIFLLSELRASESLNIILKFLSLDAEFLVFWLGDHKTETLYEPLYYLGENQLDLLKLFMYKPNVDTYIKTSVLTAVQQVYFYQPHRKNEVISWYRDILDFYISKISDSTINDSELLAFIIADIVNLHDKRLLAGIEQLFQITYISEEICGSIQEIRSIFERGGYAYESKRDLLNILNRYLGFSGTFLPEIKREHEIKRKKFPKLPINFEQNQYTKVGPNDLCPCGSGSKFKDCCKIRLN